MMRALWQGLVAALAVVAVAHGDVAARGDAAVHLEAARAIWLDARTLVWPGAEATRSYRLFHAFDAGLRADDGGIAGADNDGGTALSVAAPDPALVARYPQYAGALVLRLPEALVAQVPRMLRGQLAVVAYQGEVPVDGTQVQTGAVLDALYAETARSQRLGVSIEAASGRPTFRLWAPTAHAVVLNLYASGSGGSARSVPMMLDPASGVWSYRAADAAGTRGTYYTYSVRVFTRAAVSSGSPFGAIVDNEVTDPWAISLGVNSARARVVDLDAAATRPRGWPGAPIVTAAVPTDSVIYELQVRDFSSGDASVPAAHVGKYLAFTDRRSQGMRHLAALARAGLTHVHLLPVFDIASVDEQHCVTPSIPASRGADTAAQAAVEATQAGDCYNWGYDPWHYGAPEGSYASDAGDAVVRVRELRAMVLALHRLGLRVVMDVVYNHTSASGQDAHSVLDRIVPGYYHRLDAGGAVETHSCCADTATERALMEKLMTDTLVRWARDYQVDGFRFDLMGMIPKAALLRARAAVEAVAAADGRGHTYFYGEGWSPDAEVAAAIEPATQLNLAGTGIGTFDDRLRDAARGGAPFDTGAAIGAHRGFLSGEDGAAGLAAQDRLSVALAGNLAGYPLRPGVTGRALDYNGAPAGYTQQPQEQIAYVSVHDNETLFDIDQYKLPAGVSGADAARAQVVGLSLVVLAQGVPLIQAGDDLLRSRSGDSNSFDSGDYFNRIDWSGTRSNWGTGLPPGNTGNNAANAATLAGLLATRPAPEAAAMRATTLAFQDLLRIRRDTDLFRLRSAADIERCVSFPDQGAQVHGLIVERILGQGCVVGTDSAYRSVIVLFNAGAGPQQFALAAYAGRAPGTGSGQIALHPVQRAGSDAALKAGAAFRGDAGTGTFTVPGRSTAVFVEYP